MQVISGDAIKVRKGLKSFTGFALSDFNTDDQNVDFDIRLIEKEDAIGPVVTFNTSNKVTKVEDEKYTADPIEQPEEEIE